MNKPSSRFFSLAGALVAGAFLLAAWPGAGAQAGRPAHPIPVIFDTDIGDDIDDTWALGLLLQCPELDVKLVVGDYGKVEYRARLLAKFLQTAGRTDIPVGLGLDVEPRGDGPQEAWVKGYNLASYPGRVHKDGVQAMIDLIMNSPEPVTLIGIGPVPNLAAALEREPRIAQRARFVGMHGSVRLGYGGSTKVAPEWNVKAHPKACQKVFTAPWDMTITPLDTCGLVDLSGERYRRVRDSASPIAAAIIENYRFWSTHKDAKNKVADTRSSTLFDTVAVYLAVSQDLCRMERLGLRVTDDGFTLPDSQAKSINAAMAWKSLDGFRDWLVGRLTGGSAGAGGVRVLPEGTLPDDRRLEPLKDLDGYFPFTPPASKAEWAERAERVRRQILISQGLWPLPTRTPLRAVMHGKIDRGEYTVEKIYFESVPGLFVTGNLYRPKNVTGKAPGVLFAHGHWSDARLSESSEAELRREIAEGEERFEQGGRSRFQSMCVQLARMGCVVWQWDMLGNSDAQQLSMKLVHGFAKQRPEMNTPSNWGLFSPQAEAHLQSAMGLQTWNSIRSLDFLLTLPEVDPERIAMTGASGGGTQTMILAAIDPRLGLSFPAVMVSTAMQGGCTCENACLLRVGTGNIEFAALFAPKPQGMTTANDWTKEMATKGFPEIKRLYTLLGAPDRVLLKRGEHFPHNYNAVSRSAFYTWLNQHFKLGQKSPVLERDYEPLGREALTVWDDQHPAPKAADPDFERGLLRWLHEDAQQQLAAEQAAPERFRKTYGLAFDIVLGGGWVEVGAVERELVRESDRGAWVEKRALLRNKHRHQALPAVFCEPKAGNGHTVVWLSGQGKSALFAADGAPRAEVQQLVKSGATVAGVDLLYQGEFLADGKPLSRTPRVKNPREAAAYTYGYNEAVFAQRVQDVLSVVKCLKGLEHPPRRLTVLGLEGAGPWVAAARALCGQAIDQVVIDTGGCRFGAVLDLHDPVFLPGGAKYGDVPALLALGAPGRAWVAGETDESLALARSQYRAAQADQNLTRYAGEAGQLCSAALAWVQAQSGN